MVMKEISLQLLFENCQGISIPDRGGKIIPQPGTVNENVLESDFVSLCDGTTRRHSQVDLRRLEGM